MKLILPVVSTMPRSDDDDKYVSYKPLVTSFESYHHRTAPKRRLRLSPNDGRNASHRRNRTITYRMSILLLLLPFSSYIFVTNAAFTTTTMDVSQKPSSSSSSHRNVYTSSPQLCHTRPHPFATYHNPMGIKTKASLFPNTKLLLLLNTEMEPTSSISTTEIDRRRNTASTTTTGTTIKENLDRNYNNNNNNNQLPPKSSGDKIYSRVKAFGKLLTFQASNPKNSAYFFGRTNNKMQHYYQGVDPSRRIFQMADDLDIESNTKNNNKKKSTGTAIHQSPGSTRTTQRKKRQTDEDRYDNNTEETNAVFTTFDSNVQSFVQPAGDEREVWEALASLEKDMSLLDRMIGQKPQLSNLQLLLLGGAVLSTASSPLFLAGQLTEFIAPSMAAFTAAIGIAAEYRGRVAVADSKEVAAASLQCAAEAEGYLASAERAKAVRASYDDNFFGCCWSFDSHWLLIHIPIPFFSL